MSKLFEKINLSLNESIKKKEADRVLTLRSIVSQKKDKEIELRATDQKEILDSDVVNILNKMMKQRKEPKETHLKGSEDPRWNKLKDLL